MPYAPVCSKATRQLSISVTLSRIRLLFRYVSHLAWIPASFRTVRPSCLTRRVSSLCCSARLAKFQVKWSQSDLFFRSAGFSRRHVIFPSISRYEWIWRGVKHLVNVFYFFCWIGIGLNWIFMKGECADGFFLLGSAGRRCLIWGESSCHECKKVRFRVWPV